MKKIEPWPGSLALWVPAYGYSAEFVRTNPWMWYSEKVVPPRSSSLATLLSGGYLALASRVQEPF